MVLEKESNQKEWKKMDRKNECCLVKLKKNKSKRKKEKMR